MSDWDERLRKDGPMYCQGESCVEFREREPEFAKAMQDAEIIAHYSGVHPWYGDQWMLSGITMVFRGTLEKMIDEHRKPA